LSLQKTKATKQSHHLPSVIASASEAISLVFKRSPRRYRSSRWQNVRMGK